MLFCMYQVFSSLLGHLHFFVHFSFTFMEHLFLDTRYWGVSERTPGHKSMGCQKSEDVMGFVEGWGTLRLKPQVVLWVHRIFKVGLSHPSHGQKWPKWEKWPILLKNRVFHENPCTQCYEWTSWPQWTPKEGSGSEVPRGRTWGPPKCAKTHIYRGAPDNPQKCWRKKWKKMTKVSIIAINHQSNTWTN